MPIRHKTLKEINNTEKPILLGIFNNMPRSFNDYLSMTLDNKLDIVDKSFYFLMDLKEKYLMLLGFITLNSCSQKRCLCC